jgi:hypothetical protein
MTFASYPYDFKPYHQDSPYLTPEAQETAQEGPLKCLGVFVVASGH